VLQCVVRGQKCRCGPRGLAQGGQGGGNVEQLDAVGGVGGGEEGVAWMPRERRALRVVGGWGWSARGCECAETGREGGGVERGGPGLESSEERDPGAWRSGPRAVCGVVCGRPLAARAANMGDREVGCRAVCAAKVNVGARWRGLQGGRARVSDMLKTE
jgi:hypothetical protein